MRHGNAPPIFFCLAKENGPCTVQKKGALVHSAPVRVHCGDAGLRKRPWMVGCSLKRWARVWPDVALDFRPRPGIASGGCKTDLTSFSHPLPLPDLAVALPSFHPASAERSGERGKRSRGHSTTTPAIAAPPKRGNRTIKSVPCRTRTGKRPPKNRKHR